jgi:hypothetical protein
MKKLLFAAAFAFCCLSFKMASAQIHLSIGVNIGNQPEWGPVGYDRADYYYMPDIDAYYDVNAHTYIYFNNNVWVHSVVLPPRYAGYDVYHGYKVVINRPEPWRYENVYRTRYARYRGYRDQGIIRDSHDDRYRDHWHGDNGNHYGDRNHGGDHWDHGDHGDHGRGHGNGDDHGNGHGHGHDH